MLNRNSNVLPWVGEVFVGSFCREFLSGVFVAIDWEFLSNYYY